MIHLLLFFFYNVSIKCAVGRGPIPINNQELCVVFFLCFCLCVIKASVLEAGRGFPGGWSSCSTCLLRAYTSTDLPASPLSSASTSASTTQYHEPQLHHEPYHLPQPEPVTFSPELINKYTLCLYLLQGPLSTSRLYQIIPEMIIKKDLQ